MYICIYIYIYIYIYNCTPLLKCSCFVNKKFIESCVLLYDIASRIMLCRKEELKVGLLWEHTHGASVVGRKKKQNKKQNKTLLTNAMDGTWLSN